MWGAWEQKDRAGFTQTQHTMATVQVDGVIIMHFFVAPILMQVSLQGKFSRFHPFVHKFALMQVSAEPDRTPMMSLRYSTEDGHAASGER